MAITGIVAALPLAMTNTTTGTMSGYTDCACRDCFDVAVSSDTSKPDLCWACREAGCDADGEHECCRDDAYGCDEEQEWVPTICKGLDEISALSDLQNGIIS